MAAHECLVRFLGLAAVLAAVLAAARAQPQTLYFLKGGSLELRPAGAPEPVSSVLWKWNGDLLAEWVQDLVALKYYGPRENRASLDTSTGVLRITDCTGEDSGLYSVEVNNKLLGRSFQAQELLSVPRPEITVQPLVCGPAHHTCDLTCHGDTEGAEPVSYQWRRGQGGWEEAGKTWTITPRATETPPPEGGGTYTCRMTNPVSQEESEPVQDPFTRGGRGGGLGGDPGPAVGATVGVVVLVGLLVGGLYWFRDKEPIKGCLASLGCSGSGSGPGSGPGHGELVPTSEEPVSLQPAEGQ